VFNDYFNHACFIAGIYYVSKLQLFILKN